MESETKSSAGDKYETGRSMMQLEQAKNRSFLLEAQQVKEELLKIETKSTSDKVRIGSPVETNKGNYYISVGISKVKLEGKLYYCYAVSRGHEADAERSGDRDNNTEK